MKLIGEVCSERVRFVSLDPLMGPGVYGIQTNTEITNILASLAVNLK